MAATRCRSPATLIRASPFFVSTARAANERGTRNLQGREGEDRPGLPSQTSTHNPVKLFHAFRTTKQFPNADEAIFLNARRQPET
jgi:hypothetical protein